MSAAPAISKAAIGVRIRALRGAASQDDFAKRAGIHQPYLSRYERGLSLPDPETLLKVAVTYGTTIEWMLTGKHSAEPATILKTAQPARATSDDAELAALLGLVRRIYASGHHDVTLALRQNLHVFLLALRTPRGRRLPVIQRVGEILVARKLVTEKDVHEAIEEQRRQAGS